MVLRRGLEERRVRSGFLGWGSHILKSIIIVFLLVETRSISCKYTTHRCIDLKKPGKQNHILCRPFHAWRIKLILIQKIINYL